jgi:toxin ParE1/3/4
MVLVRFSERAQQDLQEIDEYLSGHAAPNVADNYMVAFEGHANVLRDFPRSGAPRPKLGKDVRMVVEWPYVMLYRPVGEEVVILRVLDGRRRITRKLVRSEGD